MYYKGIFSEEGKIVKKEYALGYALEQILNNEDEKNEFLLWYYSGNWIEVYEEDEKNEM